MLKSGGTTGTRRLDGTHKMRVCIVGASGKLGRYMVQHALDRGYDVVGVCREESVGKLDAFTGRMTIVPGATDDPEVLPGVRCEGEGARLAREAHALRGPG